jgi:long-chain acyl-CoA synthetase
LATTERNLAEILRRAVHLHGSAGAVVDGERRLTYDALELRVRELAALLAQRGARHGDRVAVLAANSVDYLAAYFAVPLAGLVLVPLNTRLQQPELVAQVADCEPALILFDEANRARADELAAGSAAKVVRLDEAVPTPAESLLDVDPAGDQLAAIFYTGGTSGRAKGVMLSHANLASNAVHMVAGLAYDAADTYLHCAPMFHLGDGMSLYPMTWVGGRHVVIPRFDVDAVLDAIESERVTCTFLVPAMLSLLLERLEASEESRDLSSLRLVVHGGAPISQSLLHRAIRQLGCSFTQSYGMTEAGPILSFLPREEERISDLTLQSAGQPVVGVDVRVLAEDGTECPPGEVGEIVARGPNVAAGYWNQPELTAERFRDGWYRSGDLAYRDDSYYLYIVGRAGDVIITGGENVYAAEVEATLYAHPGVQEAAVFAVPSSRWGESVHAAVETRTGAELDEATLEAHCRQLIAGYKVPRSWEFHPSLPRTGPGKVDKRALREPHWADRQRDVS